MSPTYNTAFELMKCILQMGHETLDFDQSILLVNNSLVVGDVKDFSIDVTPSRYETNIANIDSIPILL